MTVLISILSGLLGMGVGILVYWLATKKDEGEPTTEKVYFEDGTTLKSKCQYLDGYKNGVENIYYRDGMLNCTRNWDNGVLEGDFAINYPDGRRYISGSYHKGELQGNYIVYDADGIIKEQKEY